MLRLSIADWELATLEQRLRAQYRAGCCRGSRSTSCSVGPILEVATDFDRLVVALTDQIDLWRSVSSQGKTGNDLQRPRSPV